MTLTEVRAEIEPESAAELADRLLEREWGDWSVLEDAIARRAWVSGIFSEEAAARASWPGLARLLEDLGGTRGEPLYATLAESDWRDSYKAHFHAWQFGRLHWVPVWERSTFELTPGHRVLWLDPGLAFGTGNHETTRLCCERLVAWVEARPPGAGRRIVDAGCGSGILALSAALLGCGPIEAFDLDPEAVRVSGENAALNGLSSAVEFSTADLVEGLANRSADLLLANIQADVLLRFAPLLTSAVAERGQLVLSGILATEREAVQAGFAAAAPGWTFDSRQMGEWCDLCGRPGSRLDH